MNLIKNTKKNIKNEANNKTIIKNIETINTDQYNWLLNARENQLPPNDPFYIWLILAGRGFGKTRTGAETIRMWVEQGISKRIAIIGRTREETERVMVMGESGILSLYPNDKRPHYEASRARIIFENGAIAEMFSGDRYDSLRGPQFDTVWIDEFAKFKYGKDLIDQIYFSLRLGENPKCIITTTPKPTSFLKEVMNLPNTYVTIGSTFDNRKNLSEKFLDQVVNKYEGTRFGMQELYGKILDDVEGALWSRNLIKYRKTCKENYERVVIAVDPAVTYGEKSSETGIIVIAKHIDHTTYQVLDDLSGKYKPSYWAKIVVNTYFKYCADYVVVEINQGGDLVESIIGSVDQSVLVKPVRAIYGKQIRAEPVALLYEKGKVFHEKCFEMLENQMCEYIHGESAYSPDRIDALVWGISDMHQSDSNFCAWNT